MNVKKALTLGLSGLLAGPFFGINTLLGEMLCKHQLLCEVGNVISAVP